MDGRWVFRPFFRLEKRSVRSRFDWFGLHIRLCAECLFSVNIAGWGVTVGVWVYDVMEGERWKSSKS